MPKGYKKSDKSDTLKKGCLDKSESIKKNDYFDIGDILDFNIEDLIDFNLDDILDLNIFDDEQ